MSQLLVPYGKLADGKFGIALENGTLIPIAAAIEVYDNLPATASPDNFQGRTIFERSTQTLYIYVNDPTPSWRPLEGIPADVGAVAGNPPIVPTPVGGSLFYDTDTEVLFVWDGTSWKPVGGLYAASILIQRYTGNGVDTTFSMGTTVVVPSEYVEVFLDGVRQYANPSGDYDVVGPNVIFTSPVAAGVKILIRILVSDTIIQSAQSNLAQYIATGGETVLSTGVAGSDPSGVLVFKDGIKQYLSVDYTYQTQTTTISSLVSIGPTTARATTPVAHGLSIGSVVLISGVVEAGWNATITVTNTPTPTTFDFTVLPSPPATFTPDDIAFFSPPATNDTITFLAPLVAGDKIDIQTFKHIVLAPSTGEANTLISIGTGVSLAGSKVGTTLRVKSLLAGANVNIIDNGNEAIISVSSVYAFEDRVGINSFSYSVASESYVGVRNTGSPVTIDLTGIANGPASSGRKLTVADESGLAGTNNITLTGGGLSLINGLATYVISTNYGAVSIVKDGFNWVVVSRSP